MAANYGDYLRKNPDGLEAMVYTLASRREHLKLASYCITDGVTVGEPAPPSERQGARHVAFVFTGQGAQWVGMGREMLLGNAEFAASIRRMDVVLASLEHAPEWTLEETLLADAKADKDLLNPTDRSQPVCTAVQVAYVDALGAWGIKPSAVVGHSSGEIAGAYAAGVLTLEEAIITAYYRGYGCARSTAVGGMAALGMGRDKVERLLKPGVVVACENSNASVTISGDLKALKETMESVKQEHPDMFVRQLRVPMAYHSHHMAEVASLYSSLLVPHLAPKPPKVPFYSTVYGRQVLEAKVFGPQYWKLNMVSPVLFRAGVLQMLEDLPDTVHLEIGPHSALSGPLRQIYKEAGRSASYAAVAERGEDASRAFLTSLGKVYCFGITPQPPITDKAYTLPDLPTYPWNYEGGRHWAETRVMEGYRFRKHRKHELLGIRIIESSEVEPAWRNVIRVSDIPWVADHCVEKDMVFPAAGYIAMAGAAITQVTGSTAGYTVQDVHIAAALLLREDRGIELVTTLRKRPLTATNDSKFWEFSISSENNGTWTKHCWGLVTSGCAVALPPNPDVAPFTRVVDSKRWYTTLSRIGLNYSNRFVGLENISASPVAQVASLSITDRQVEGEEYALHPSTLDQVLQSWSVALAKGEHHQLDKLFLPTFIEQFYVGTNGSQSALRARTSSQGKIGAAVGSSYGLVDAHDKSEIAFVLNGFQTSRLEGGDFTQSAPELRYMSIQWHPAIGFADPSTLIRPSRDATADIILSEQYGLLAAVEIHQVAASVESLAQPYFKHFLDGITKHMGQVDNGLSKIPNAAELKGLTQEARLAKMVEWREQTVGGPVEAIVEELWRVAVNIRDILEGRKALIDVLLEGGMLQKFYDETNSFSDIKNYFRALGLNKPQIRVLEIGAGTGSVTANILEAMHSAEGERLYEDYTITDVSAGFVNQTKERFANYDNLKFAVCDITADPVEQGFEPAAYDLIIASNVSHPLPTVDLSKFHEL
jgi:acyl transferase domain-containing protein